MVGVRYHRSSHWAYRKIDSDSQKKGHATAVGTACQNLAKARTGSEYCSNYSLKIAAEASH